MSDKQNIIDCSKCCNKRCIFAGTEIEKEMCYDYKPSNDKRNKIDCAKCHNDKCALAGKEYNMALCSGYKPLTHYDEIHSMNVEQLAEWIDENSCNAMWCDPSAPVEPNTGMCAIYDCKKCIVKWLESEVKDGTSNKVGRKD